MFRLLATTAGTPVVIEAVGSPGAVEHRLALPASRAESVVDQLRAAILGLSVEEVPVRPPMDVSHAVELRLSTKRRPLRSDDLAGVNRAILTALAQLHRGERLSIQWILGRSLPAVAVPNHLEGLGQESWIGALLLAPFGSRHRQISSCVTPCVLSKSEAGWQAVGAGGRQGQDHEPRTAVDPAGSWCAWKRRSSWRPVLGSQGERQASRSLQRLAGVCRCD